MRTPGAMTGSLPLLRLKSGEGLGPTIGFSWSNTTGGDAIAGETRRVGEIRVRPVMVGAAHTKEFGRFAASASLVAGYAFCRLQVDDATRALYGRSVGATRASIATTNSFAWRPEVALWYDVSPRVGVQVALMYVAVHPTLRFSTDVGDRTLNPRVNAIGVSMGLSYGVF